MFVLLYWTLLKLIPLISIPCSLLHLNLGYNTWYIMDFHGIKIHGYIDPSQTVITPANYLASYWVIYWWYVFVRSYGSLLKSQSEKDAADLHFSSSTSASSGSSEEEEITSHNNAVAASVRNNTRHGGISYVLISQNKPVINWSEKRKYFFFQLSLFNYYWYMMVLPSPLIWKKGKRKLR